MENPYRETRITEVDDVRWTHTRRELMVMRAGVWQEGYDARLQEEAEMLKEKREK